MFHDELGRDVDNLRTDEVNKHFFVTPSKMVWHEKDRYERTNSMSKVHPGETDSLAR